MARLIPTCFYDIQGWARQAAKEHVSIKDTQNTHWFQWREGRLLAIGGFIWVGRSKARIKGIWVLPCCRKWGHGTRMTEAIIREAEKAGATTIEAIALNPAWYEARGFERIKELRPGSWVVRRG